MARILITGSAQGIGLRTARDLAAAGHSVTLHARNDERAAAARSALPEAADVVVGDLSLLSSTVLLGERLAADPYDVVVHNAGVGGGERVVTADGLSQIFQVNVLAPYVLTALLPSPARAVYLTSGLQSVGRVSFDDAQWDRRQWDGMQAYSDSKLYDVMLALWVARNRPGTVSNAVDPGWVKTRMGGAGAEEDLPAGAETQVWLASSDEPAALETGRYLKHRRVLRPNPAATDQANQERLLDLCAGLSGIALR